MKNKEISKKHLLKTVKDIKKALDNIQEEIIKKSDTDYWLMTLLCRVGELELCLTYNLESRHPKGKEIQLKPNRLCECYEKLSRGDQYEI